MGLYFIIVLFFCIYICVLEIRYENAFKDIKKEYLIKIVSIKERRNYTNKYIGKIYSR